MGGSVFGIGSPTLYPVQQNPWGLSPYGAQATSAYSMGLPLLQILQLLQVIPQQLQQLQQLEYVQQQQLQQVQQIIQFVPHQIQQLQQQLLAQQSPLGQQPAPGWAQPQAFGLPFQAAPPLGPQLFTAQPGHVM